MYIKSDPSPRQANIKEKICVSLRRLANSNGGLRDLAGKTQVSYNALWGQLNRGQGVLAHVIPEIVRATGDPRLLCLLADACGYMVVPKPRVPGTHREIRRQGTGLAIAVGKALEAIEQALRDGLINSLERDEIRWTLDRVSLTSLEIGETLRQSRCLGSRRQK